MYFLIENIKKNKIKKIFNFCPFFFLFVKTKKKLMRYILVGKQLDMGLSPDCKFLCMCVSVCVYGCLCACKLQVNALLE